MLCPIQTQDHPNSVATNSTSKDSSTSKSSPPQIAQQTLSTVASESIPIVSSAKLSSANETLPGDATETQGEVSNLIPSKSEPKDSADGETSIEAVKAAQLKIEEEMQKRRQRLEAWRQNLLAEEKSQEEAMKERDSLTDSDKKMGWSLEDEEEDQFEESDSMETKEGEVSVSNEDNEREDIKMDESDIVEAVNNEPKEDVDPLDAFMMGVKEEVSQIKKQVHKNSRDKLSTNGEL